MGKELLTTCLVTSVVAVSTVLLLTLVFGVRDTVLIAVIASVTSSIVGSSRRNAFGTEEEETAPSAN